ncbi:MAG TPA: hypothetical protein DEG44_04205 [Candidatus Kerfeldbacteria bacterium]|nr:hypothetical protein [Candidatus Kerfeldbacteria bacterium]
MSTHLRQLIFLIVTFTSTIGLAWILLYSSGYNFNVTQLAFQPTGGIRVAVYPSKEVEVALLPNNELSHASETTFTHLLPGEYQLIVTSPHYRTINLVLDVAPNVTSMIDPLYLWPEQVPLSVATVPDKLGPLHTTELPIVFQSILANTTIPDQSDYVLVTQRQFIVLNKDTHTVTEYVRDGSVITSQQLGSAVTEMALAQHQLLLVSQFGLTVVDVLEHTSETITRLSTPIQTASWVTNTPYIAYSTADTVHIVDSRLQVDYLDQLVATTPEPITDLWYDAELNSLWLTTATAHYRWPLELVI